MWKTTGSNEGGFHWKLFVDLPDTWDTAGPEEEGTALRWVDEGAPANPPARWLEGIYISIVMISMPPQAPGPCHPLTQNTVSQHVFPVISYTAQ